MSSREFPLDEVSDAIETRIRSIASDFSPIVQLVASDEYWNIPATAAKLSAQLPAWIVTWDESVSDRVPGPEVLETQFSFKANYLYGLTDANRNQMRDAVRRLTERFTSGEHFDDFPELAALLTNSELVEVVPTGSRPNDQLVGINIGWAEVDLAVRIHAAES